MKLINFFFILLMVLSSCSKDPLPVTQAAPAATEAPLPPATSTPLSTATPTSTHTPLPTTTLTHTPTQPPPTTTNTPGPTATSPSYGAHTESWDLAARKRFVPRPLKELLLLATDRLSESKDGMTLLMDDAIVSRVIATYTGKFRDASALSQITAFLWLTTKNPEIDHDLAMGLYATEALFTDDGLEYWLLIQTPLVESLKAEAKEGKPVILYTSLVGGHREGEQITPVLPVVEFLVPAEVSETVEDAPIFCPTKNDQAREAYEEANELRDQEKVAEAEAKYLKAVELDPGYCDAMDNLAVMLRRHDRVDEAIHWYQRSLEVKPDNTIALRNLGLAYYFQEKFEQAIPVFEQLIQIASDDPEGYYGLGVSHYDLEQYEDAISALEVAEVLYLQNGSPFTSDAQYYLGLSYFKLDDCLRSRGYLAPIYTEVPDDVRANVCLGICYLNEEPKDLELVKKYFLKAEALGYELPEDWVAALVNVFGRWPPK